MEKNLRLCYELDESLGIVVDEEGNVEKGYACIRFKTEKYKINRSTYKELVEEFRLMIASQLDCDIELVKPITLNEYLDQTEECYSINEELMNEGLYTL